MTAVLRFHGRSSLPYAEGTENRHPIPLALAIFPLPLCSLSLMGKDCVIDASAGDVHSIVGCSLLSYQLWISVIVLPAVKRNSLDEGGTILICGYKDRCLGYG